LGALAPWFLISDANRDPSAQTSESVLDAAEKESVKAYTAANDDAEIFSLLDKAEQKYGPKSSLYIRSVLVKVSPLSS